MMPVANGCSDMISCRWTFVRALDKREFPMVALVVKITVARCLLAEKSEAGEDNDCSDTDGL